MNIESTSSRWWPPGFQARDAATFVSLVQKSLDDHAMAYSGTVPDLVGSDDRTLFLGNLAARCARSPRSKWSAMIGEFMATVAGFSGVDDPCAISPEVVRDSLRLRLFTCDDTTGRRSVPRVVTRTESLHRLIVRRPAMPGTEWLLYLRRPGAGQGVLADHLARWAIPQDEAFELARRNTLATERGELYGRRDLLLESGDSMFAHAAVLSVGGQRPFDAGLAVAVPNRHEVVAAVVTADDAGIEAMVAVMVEAVSRYSSAPYPICSGAWFVPPAGIGTFGENAEPIVLNYEALAGRVTKGARSVADLGSGRAVSFGPNTRDFFAALG